MSAIILKNVTKLYDSRGITGVRDLCAEFHKGKLYSLVGPSGCGKTTSLKLILGEIQKDSGYIEKSELNIVKLNQSKELNDKQTVFENLKTVGTQSKPEQFELQIRYWLEHFEITNEINNPISTLSEGQKQRVHLIKSLLFNPDFLLLDEPFGHLDFKLRKEIMGQLFKQLKEKQIGVIWVTHDLKNAMAFSDEILVMNHGKIEQQATPYEIYFHPKNIVVAQFFGECNIIVGKYEMKNNTTQIKTPYINISCSKDSPQQTLSPCFLLRAEKIFIDTNSGLKGRVKASLFQGSHYLNSIEFETAPDLWFQTAEKPEEFVAINFKASDLIKLPAL